MMGRTVRTQQTEEQFLAAVVETGGNITAACKATGIGRRTVYEWRDDEPEFREKLERALEQGTDVLEDEVTRRAFQGTDRPVFYKGAQCGSITEYSDTLAMFMLKARRPERFKDRVSTEQLGPDGKAVAPASGFVLVSVEK